MASYCGFGSGGWAKRPSCGSLSGRTGSGSRLDASVSCSACVVDKASTIGCDWLVRRLLGSGVNPSHGRVLRPPTRTDSHFSSAGSLDAGPRLPISPRCLLSTESFSMSKRRSGSSRSAVTCEKTLSHLGRCSCSASRWRTWPAVQCCPTSPQPTLSTRRVFAGQRCSPRTQIFRSSRSHPGSRGFNIADVTDRDHVARRSVLVVTGGPEGSLHAGRLSKQNLVVPGPGGSIPQPPQGRSTRYPVRFSLVVVSARRRTRDAGERPCRSAGRAWPRGPRRPQASDFHARRDGPCDARHR